MAEALIGLGGNVGDARAALSAAIEMLCDGRDVRLTARSSDYRTPPWGMTAQPPFINACIAVHTTLTPHALLARALEVERAFGRDRAREQRWGPRTLDIDLLAYDDAVSRSSSCHIRTCSSGRSFWSRSPRSRPTGRSPAYGSPMRPPASTGAGSNG